MWRSACLALAHGLMTKSIRPYALRAESKAVWRSTFVKRARCRSGTDVCVNAGNGYTQPRSLQKTTDHKKGSHLAMTAFCFTALP